MVLPVLPVKSQSVALGCRSHSPAMKTRPCVLTIPDECGIAVAAIQSGKCIHVHVIISQALVLPTPSANGEMARFMSNARERVRKSIGQNPPALVSQMVPLHLRYRPMPIPRMHGIIPNTAIPTNAFCRADEPAIPFPFEEARESTHT